MKNGYSKHLMRMVLKLVLFLEYLRGKLCKLLGRTIPAPIVFNPFFDNRIHSEKGERSHGAVQAELPAPSRGSS